MVRDQGGAFIGFDDAVADPPRDQRPWRTKEEATARPKGGDSSTAAADASGDSVFAGACGNDVADATNATVVLAEEKIGLADGRACASLAEMGNSTVRQRRALLASKLQSTADSYSLRIRQLAGHFFSLHMIGVEYLWAHEKPNRKL